MENVMKWRAREDVLVREAVYKAVVDTYFNDAEGRLRVNPLDFDDGLIDVVHSEACVLISCFSFGYDSLPHLSDDEGNMMISEYLQEENTTFIELAQEMYDFLMKLREANPRVDYTRDSWTMHRYYENKENMAE